ncbi:hypothetical protein [Pseudoalteromonas sp. NGC95]|uniref:hypothetical protein n=1 Tax=Pseudoalteromonas sp. NGC95 TaxID=2792051 RepID=UPI0018CE1243|nr:hypothetical protein [Pseudoalteromonas sp. NGC95]MBH0017903.1 hypothetical protein [Pseudoalteromonas sp. NGC95]
MKAKKTFGRPSADIEINLDEDGVTWESPITGKLYTFKMVEINSSTIGESTKPSPYNHRSQEFLTRADVSDILPSIKENRCNTQPIRAVGTKKSMVILEGTRRTYCVSLLNSGVLKVLLTPEMDLVDQEHIATIADEYRKPTVIDLSLQINELGLLDESVRKIAEKLKIAKTSAQYAKDFAILPTRLFKLFPGLSFIKTRFLISLKHNETLLNEALEICNDFTAYLSPENLEKHNNHELLDDKAYADASRKVEKEILQYTEAATKTKRVLPDAYNALNSIEGIKASTDGKGTLKLNISKEKAENLIEQLRAVLEA